jgi:DNA-binding CsgD family transcriptional regulator
MWSREEALDLWKSGKTTEEALKILGIDEIASN